MHHPLARAATWGLLLAGAIGCRPAPPSRAATPAVRPSSSAAPRAPSTVAFDAIRAARRTLVVDGHIDLPYRLRRAIDGGVPVDVALRAVVDGTSKGDFDWPRAHAGGLDAPFMSIYVPASYQAQGGAKDVADGLIDLVEQLARLAPDKFVVATSVADVRKAFAAGKVALPLGIENGAALEGNPNHLVHFHRRGVRYITLTHSEDNALCDSSYADTHIHNGLSDLGRQVVRQMNALGIMVDVSHISDDAFWQVMDVARAPVIASHSSARHFTPGFERNIADDMIARVAEGGGVVMINYGSTFLTREARAWSDAYYEARTRHATQLGLGVDHPKVKAFAEAYRKENPLPRANVTDVADHIERVIEIAGIEHVGLGSDYDGVGDTLPEGLEDPSRLPNLFAEL
ncbi:MAG: dipeptidase, partial [Myxococcota bacterium]